MAMVRESKATKKVLDRAREGLSEPVPEMGEPMMDPSSDMGMFAGAPVGIAASGEMEMMSTLRKLHDMLPMDGLKLLKQMGFSSAELAGMSQHLLKMGADSQGWKYAKKAIQAATSSAISRGR